MDKLLVTQEASEHHERRKAELEKRLAALETEYEELLGGCLQPTCSSSSYGRLSEKTIHDEETSNVDVAESMADYKVRRQVLCAEPQRANKSLEQA